MFPPAPEFLTPEWKRFEHAKSFWVLSRFSMPKELPIYRPGAAGIVIRATVGHQITGARHIICRDGIGPVGPSLTVLPCGGVSVVFGGSDYEIAVDVRRMRG